MSRTTHLGCCRVGVPEAAPLATAIRRPHCTHSVRFQSQGSSEPLAPSRRVSGERASPVSASPPRPRAGRWGTGLHWRSSRLWRFPLHGAPLKRAAPVTVRPLESRPAGQACSQRERGNLLNPPDARTSSRRQRSARSLRHAPTLQPDPCLLPHAQPEGLGWEVLGTSSLGT